MLQPKVNVQKYFYWSDVAVEVAKELNCHQDDFHHTFLEWMGLEDSEAGSEDIGVQHNFDKQIEVLEAKIRDDLEVTGQYDDLDDEELEEAIAEDYYGLAFLKAIKKVLGEHSTDAAFLYSW